jgi:hypothetical protein
MSEVWQAAPYSRIDAWAETHGARYELRHSSYSEKYGRIIDRGALVFKDPEDAIAFRLKYGV